MPCGNEKRVHLDGYSGFDSARIMADSTAFCWWMYNTIHLLKTLNSETRKELCDCLDNQVESMHFWRDARLVRCAFVGGMKREMLRRYLKKHVWVSRNDVSHWWLLLECHEEFQGFTAAHLKGTLADLWEYEGRSSERRLDNNEIEEKRLLTNPPTPNRKF
jgi:hypothetical protein